MGRTLDAIDITDNPELLRLVKAVGEHDGPIILRQAGEDVAVIRAVKPAGNHRPRCHPTEEDIAAFRSAAGGWKDVDTDRLLADIYAGRDCSVGSRGDG